jgi:hypothetical protein
MGVNMNRRKTLELASQQFYKFEKWILAESKLKKLSPSAKLLYMVIRDREELSLKNAKDFTDKEGYLFQYFDQVKAGELLGLSKNAIIKAFKDLQDYKLIEVVRQGQGKPNRLYVLDYEVSEDTLKELSYEDKKASTVPPVKANKENIKTNNSIPQNDQKDTDKNEKNKKSEIVEIINNSCVNIRKQDLKKCEEEFTDIDKLKEALEICEINIASGKKSHGIKALRLAYKYGDRSSNTNADNDKRKRSIYMADSKVDVNGELKSMEDMSNEEIMYKLDLKNGTNWSGKNPNCRKKINQSCDIG